MSQTEEDVEGSVWEGSNGEKAYNLSSKVILLAFIFAILSIFVGNSGGKDLGPLGEAIGRAFVILLIGFGISVLLRVYSSFCYKWGI
jgi:hypothetical protein